MDTESGGVKHIWNIKPTEEDQDKFNQINARKIYESLSTLFSEEDDDVFKSRAGVWIGKTKNNRDFSKLNTLIIDGEEDIKISFKENIRSATCTGEIMHGSLIYSTEEEILTNLKENNTNIVSVRKNKRYINKQEVDEGVIVITFWGRVKPEKVKIFRKVISTDEHIPKPKRCSNCQQFRHIRRFCDSPAVCAKCAGDHDTQGCDSNIQKCVNCNGEHWA